MSAPQIVSVDPQNEEVDVVLGQALSITFDQAMDTSTINDATFSLSCPAPTQIVTSQNLVTSPAADSSVVKGTFTFSTDDQGRTIATFQPATGFQPNTEYTALLLGSDANLASEDVKNANGEVMVVSYQWTFTTRTLNLTVPPPISPLIENTPPIQPKHQGNACSRPVCHYCKPLPHRQRQCRCSSDSRGISVFRALAGMAHPEW